jgi:hypothetical protein
MSERRTDHEVPVGAVPAGVEGPNQPDEDHAAVAFTFTVTNGKPSRGAADIQRLANTRLV